MTQLTIQLIQEASQFLENKIYHTTVEQSNPLSKRCGVPVWMKLEFLQKTGSFKVRGAYFSLSKLSEEERKRGVVTASAGNHGKGVAFAAQKLGIPAIIYVPQSVDQSKYQGILDYSAKIIKTEFPGFDETEALAVQAAKDEDKVYISPFDDEYVMAGNGGTLAQEIATECPEARTFILPCGGGGLSAGFAYYMKKQFPDSMIIACQHENSPGLKLSLEKGKAMTRLPPIETVAGGIEGGLGTKTFEILKDRVDQVVLCSEKEIIEATQWMLKNHQYLIEPSSAVVIAACLTNKIKATTGVVIVLTGRNVDLDTLKRIFK